MLHCSSTILDNSIMLLLARRPATQQRYSRCYRFWINKILAGRRDAEYLASNCTVHCILFSHGKYYSQDAIGMPGPVGSSVTVLAYTCSWLLCTDCIGWINWTSLVNDNVILGFLFYFIDERPSVCFIQQTRVNSLQLEQVYNTQHCASKLLRAAKTHRH